ncbi:MAG: SDR family NAD(P)-dependent oxidoreductase [Labilithrix sp.]|nr:SDR family NAD(P)-dependent oxidoreductase [Labilithrix sp.]MCW5816827.1 SDR family NAD(P)-dependent oxidoreductase [Labilithrix sp.]
MSAPAEQKVLVFGATSAIAAEAVYLYAARGDRLHLVGRNREKLDAVTKQARISARAPITTRQADLGDLDANEALVAECLEELGGVDVVLIAHGDLGDQLATERSFAAAHDVLKTNLLSVVSLLIPLANAMEAARHGKIGVITSVAAERGRPRNFTYGAAKGALNVYCQGLRSRLYPAGVTVTTLKVGPTDTPMTKDHAKNPFFATPQLVARCSVRAIDAGEGDTFVPARWSAIMPIVKNTPEAVFQKLSFLSGR